MADERTGTDVVALPWQLWLLVGVMAVVELALSAADRGWLGSPDWRTIAFLHGAFFRQLLVEPVRPLFEEQPVTMFVSHAFLHGGIVHLALNATALLAIGKFIAERIGPWPMLALFLISAIAGGLGFFLLSSARGPMVGASGAVFGFIGLWLFLESRARRVLGRPMKPVWSTILGLVAANVVLALLFSGALAWEAHLGGFLAGVALGPASAVLIRRRRRRSAVERFWPPP
ncbi:MAG: rhomboid family intramembrane serine protease [Paracoccaceae bacterium]|nr:rhomboid family intramembrane serine protease [Paracoccaceae bacterium]